MGCWRRPHLTSKSRYLYTAIKNIKKWRAEFMWWGGKTNSISKPKCGIQRQHKILTAAGTPSFLSFILSNNKMEIEKTGRHSTSNIKKTNYTAQMKQGNASNPLWYSSWKPNDYKRHHLRSRKWSKSWMLTRGFTLKFQFHFIEIRELSATLNVTFCHEV